MIHACAHGTVGSRVRAPFSRTRVSSSTNTRMSPARSFSSGVGVNSNGLIRLATLVAALCGVLGASSVAHAADKKLPVVDKKLYPMRFNPEISFMGDYS